MIRIHAKAKRHNHRQSVYAIFMGLGCVHHGTGMTTVVAVEVCLFIAVCTADTRASHVLQ